MFHKLYSMSFDLNFNGLVLENQKFETVLTFKHDHFAVMTCCTRVFFSVKNHRKFTSPFIHTYHIQYQTSIQLQLNTISPGRTSNACAGTVHV